MLGRLAGEKVSVNASAVTLMDETIWVRSFAAFHVAIRYRKSQSRQKSCIVAELAGLYSGAWVGEK